MPSTQDGETDFSTCIDIGVEPCSSCICSFCFDFRGSAWVFHAELNGELEEAEFVGSAMRTDDQGFEMAHVAFLASYRYGCAPCQQVISSLLVLMMPYTGRFPVGSERSPVWNQCSVLSPRFRYILTLVILKMVWLDMVGACDCYHDQGIRDGIRKKILSQERYETKRNTARGKKI